MQHTDREGGGVGVGERRVLKRERINWNIWQRCKVTETEVNKVREGCQWDDYRRTGEFRRRQVRGCRMQPKTVDRIYNRITGKQQNKLLNINVDNSFLLGEKKNIRPLRLFWQPAIGWPKPLLTATRALGLYGSSSRWWWSTLCIWAEPFQVCTTTRLGKDSG